MDGFLTTVAFGLPSLAPALHRLLQRDIATA